MERTTFTPPLLGGKDANKPPLSPSTSSRKLSSSSSSSRQQRHRRTASTVSPLFRIGGKMDPGRFVAQHQQQFLILGFHDEERSDQDFEVRSDEERERAAEREQAWKT